MTEQSRDTRNTGESRNARDYADALAVVAEITGAILTSFIPGGKAAKIAVNVARAGNIAKAVAQNADSITPVINTVIENAPSAIKGASKVAGDAGKSIKNAAGVAYGAASAPLRVRIASMNDTKARREARSLIIKHADISMDVPKFKENVETYKTLVNNAENSSYLGYSGCYIFLTRGKGARKDTADYKDVFVGSAIDLGRSISSELAGKGNVDVYADIKYGKNVIILVYSCPVDSLEEMKTALITALDADSSYNKEAQVSF